MCFFLSVLSKQLCTINCKKSFVHYIHGSRYRPFSITSILATDSTRSISKLDSLPVASHKLNCDIHILTADGVLRVNSGPFNRAEICREYDLEPRDLQKIDTDLHINVPLIDVRHGKFVCFSFRRHRGLVQSDRSIFFVPSTEKMPLEPLGLKNVNQWEHISHIYRRNIRYIHQLYNERYATQNTENSSSKSTNRAPFEFKIIEIITDSIANGLKLKTYELLAEFETVRESAYDHINVASLRQFALIKGNVDKHKRNADLAHKAIVDVLAVDEDMVGMYLTDHHQRDISDHIKAELLLEACAKQMAEVCRTIYDLSDSVQTLESATGFMLDAVRNELIAFEIRINIITMAFGVGAFIAAIYGMNLHNGFEEHPYAFIVLTASSTCIITGLIAVGLNRLFRYRRVRLHRANKKSSF